MTGGERGTCSGDGRAREMLQGRQTGFATALGPVLRKTVDSGLPALPQYRRKPYGNSARIKGLAGLCVAAYHSSANHGYPHSARAAAGSFFAFVGRMVWCRPLGDLDAAT